MASDPRLVPDTGRQLEFVKSIDNTSPQEPAGFTLGAPKPKSAPSEAMAAEGPQAGGPAAEGPSGLTPCLSRAKRSGAPQVDREKLLCGAPFQCRCTPGEPWGLAERGTVFLPSHVSPECPEHTLRIQQQARQTGCPEKLS